MVGSSRQDPLSPEWPRDSRPDLPAAPAPRGRAATPGGVEGETNTRDGAAAARRRRLPDQRAVALPRHGSAARPLGDIPGPGASSQQLTPRAARRESSCYACKPCRGFGLSHAHTCAHACRHTHADTHTQTRVCTHAHTLCGPAVLLREHDKSFCPSCTRHGVQLATVRRHGPTRTDTDPRGEGHTSWPVVPVGPVREERLTAAGRV